MKKKSVLGYALFFSLCLLAAPEPAQALEIIIGFPYKHHRIGHTAVRVKSEKHGEVIYDYGRYGKTWGYLRLHGEGIMRVWRGKRATRRYIRRQRSFRNSIGFTIKVTPEEEKRIEQYYKNLLKSARWVKRYRSHTRYRLKLDYNGVTRQCTSLALNGLKNVWPRQRWEQLLMPKHNKGRGFNRKTHRYFFRQQKKHGLNEVVVPLDVLASFREAVRNNSPYILRVTRYPKFNRKRRASR